VEYFGSIICSCTNRKIDSPIIETEKTFEILAGGPGENAVDALRTLIPTADRALECEAELMKDQANILGHHGSATLDTGKVGLDKTFAPP
jgi:hypothetical protein